MPPTRRSLSQQLNKLSAENKNISNFSSDVDISTKRNSWWKNLSENKRQSLLVNRLNNDSSISDDQNSEWLKNLSDWQVPIKIKSITDKGNNDIQVSHIESEESENENVAPKKSIFAIQEARSQKNRFSHAFNFKTEKLVRENEQQLEQEIEIQNVHSIEEPKIENSSTEGTKKNKKRKKGKRLFQVKAKKRKYSDVFIPPNKESQETNQKDEPAAKKQIVQKNNIVDNAEDSDTDVLTDKIKRKKDLFKITPKKKKYSQAFISSKNESIGKENNINDIQKEVSSNDSSGEIVEERQELFKIKQNKKKYSEAFGLQSHESVEKLDKNDSQEKDLQKEESIEDNSTEIVEEKRRLFQLAQKKKKYSQAFANSRYKSMIIDSQSSEEEIEINTSRGSNRITGNRSSSKIHENLSQKNINSSRLSAKYSQGEGSISKNISTVAAEENKLFQVSQKRKNDSQENGLQKEGSIYDNSTEIIEEKKRLFQLAQRKKKYSQAFANSQYKSVIIDSQSSPEEIEIYSSRGSNRKTRNRSSSRIIENPSQKNRNSSRLSEKYSQGEGSILKNIPTIAPEENKLFQINQKRKNYSQTFTSSKNESIEKENINYVQNNDSSNDSPKEIIEEKQELFKVNQKKKKYSEAFGLQNFESMEKLDKNDSQENHLQKEGSTDDNSTEIIEEKKRLFQLAQKKKKYSQAFANSQYKSMVLDSQSSEEEMEINISRGSNRITRNRSTSRITENPSQKNRNSSRLSAKHSEGEGSILKNISSAAEENKLFQVNQKRKNYSQAFTSSKKEEEIEINSSRGSNRNTRNRSSFTINENPSQKNRNSSRLSVKYPEGEVSIAENISTVAASRSKNRFLNSETSEEEIIIEEVLTQQNTTPGNNRILRNQKSNVKVEKTAKFEKNNKPQINNRQDEGTVEETVLTQTPTVSRSKHVLDIQKSEEEIENTDISSRNIRSLRSQSNSKNEKTPQKNLNPQSPKNKISNSSKKKMSTPTTASQKRNLSNKNIRKTIQGLESDEVQESEPEGDIKSKGLFQLNKKSKKYSEAFKNVENSQYTDGHNMKQISQEHKENSIKTLTPQEIIARRKESSEPKYSEAFMEILAMQKQSNDGTDSNISSIPSIDISDEIKHPLFKFKSRKSVKEQKSVEPPKISYDGGSTKKTSKKRISSISTSPADSGISKFFEESLISSTKLLINPNGEKSAVKKKHGRQSKIPSIKEMNDVDNVETEANQGKQHIENTQKNKTIIVPETKENETPNYNQIDNSEKVAEPVREISKRTNKSMSITSISSSSSPENMELVKNKNNTSIHKIVANKIINKPDSPSLLNGNSRFLLNKSTSLINRTSKSRNSDISKKTRDSISITGISKLEVDTKEKTTLGNSMTQHSSNNKNISKSSEKVLNEQGSSLRKSKTNYSVSTESLDSSPLSDDDPVVHVQSRTQNKIASQSTIKKPIELSSNIISIRSTDINGRLNPSQNIENWLSRSIMVNERSEDENEEFIRNTEFPSIRKSTLFSGFRNTNRSLNEREILERKKMLLASAKNTTQQKNRPVVTEKKITEYFKKLEKHEKLKPIPKTTNKVKKVQRPVCTARLVDGKPYYSKKLFRGERWCTPQFYKFIQNKIKDECGDNTINESENIMKIIVQHVKSITASKKYKKEEVDKFKIELAERKIISTIYDFCCFCFNYLPAQYRELAVPMTRGYASESTVPIENPLDIFKPII